MRRFAAVVLAGSLFTSNAFAASSDAALTPGKPAGVQNATLSGNGLLILFGLAIVAGGAALVATEGSGNNIAASTSATTTTRTTTTTTTTSP